jgi:lipopolysaccharide export system permease protein
MIPVAVLLGALFVVGRLSSQNELAALKASGVSLYRILAPFLIVALLISFLSIYIGGWLVPYANQKKIYIERTHLNRGYQPSVKFNLFFQVGKNEIVSVNYYDTQTQIANKVSIQDFSPQDGTKLSQRYDAQQMRWRETDPEGKQGTWILQRGTCRQFSDTGQTLTSFSELPFKNLLLNPEDIEKKQRTPDEMNYTDLGEFVQNQLKAGQDVSRWLVEYHAKIAFPFASVIMVLFAVPFAAGRPRAGTALGFGIATAVTFLYLGFMKASQVFGYNGDIDPFITAWMANIIFLVAGVINLLRVQK